MHRLAIILVAAAFSFTTPAIALAQTDDARLALAATLLDRTHSTRSNGMGVTGVADLQDAANGFRNPAILSAVQGIVVAGGYDRFNGDVAHYDFLFATSIPVRQNSSARLGLSLTHSRTETQFYFTSVVSGLVKSTLLGNGDQMVAVRGSYGWFFDRWAYGVGVGVNLDQPTGGVDKRSTDLGGFLAHRVPVGDGSVDMRVALAGKNLGQSFNTDEPLLPKSSVHTRTGFSLSYRSGGGHAGNHPAARHTNAGALAVTVNYDLISWDDTNRDTIGGIGVELGLQNAVFLRTGANDDYATFGAGVRVSLGAGIVVDVEYAAMDPSDTNTALDLLTGSVGQTESLLTHSFGGIIRIDI